MFDTTLDAPDMSMIRGDVNSILLRAYACLAMQPPDTAEALELADEAMSVASGWKLHAEVSKAEFYRAECYRLIGEWRKALQSYVRAAGRRERMADIVHGTRICVDKIEEMEAQERWRVWKGL